MRIVIVNFSDSEGGAARAAYRLHESLLSQGLDSIMLVASKRKHDPSVMGPSSIFQKAIYKFKSHLNKFPLRKYVVKVPFSPSFSPSLGVVEKINKLKPDIVHIHWIHAGMLKFEDISRIKAPLVWTLHDMWLFTGGCHYAGECKFYLTHCGKCPALTSSKKNDLSNSIFSRKKEILKETNNITIVGLSEWIKNCATSSFLLKDKSIVRIPNPIDTNKFKPSPMLEAREFWRFPVNRKLVLFGAMSSTTDVRKGYLELKQALEKLKNPNVELVVFGNNTNLNQDVFGFKTHSVGTIEDDSKLMFLYNAADLMVVPSLEENLSNAIAESLACGTPVVCFDIGGNGDLVEHMHNGYLAQRNDVEDLKNGIDWVLAHKDAEKLSRKSRDTILQKMEPKLIAKKYEELYHKISHN
ncbi:glycosyltransferase family 4 protein [Subsaxibacter sp. CAU 1640]|uniref:glycosyltransferase family 4 protein n=1 Tax=Subsaxibacter sp. CAU 1640 TaxID=2933271 RepID=UPI002005806E|nr:glycosyltransferase family 4 protein [Subsaxibacter sp. CAU 1640]MCK7589527.1 glycosyltransferase family 4 protein [Subsaxibacter sp. CAU 1640]